MKNPLLFLLLLCACSSPKDGAEQNFKEQSDIIYSQLILDSVFVYPEEYSGIGFYFMGGEELYFADQVYSKVYGIDSKGNLQGPFLGKGDSPYETRSILGMTVSEGNFIILNDFQVSTFSENFERINQINISFEGTESYDKMLNAPNESMVGIYQVDWKPRSFNTNFLLEEKSNHLILPIHTEHPLLNGYFVADYYRKAAVLGALDRQSGKVAKIGGSRSVKYQDYEFLPNFDFSHFAKSNDEIMVSFAIDHLIHVFDTDFNLLRKFGVVGQDMNTDYRPTKTLDDADDQFFSDRQTKGFYEHIWMDKNDGLLFRTYYPNGTKGANARLQIYTNEILSADFEVPLRFRVIGKIDGNYIADGIVSEELDQLGFYKFSFK